MVYTAYSWFYQLPQSKFAQVPQVDLPLFTQTWEAMKNHPHPRSHAMGFP